MDSEVVFVFHADRCAHFLNFEDIVLGIVEIFIVDVVVQAGTVGIFCDSQCSSMDRSEYSDILDGSPLAVKPVPAGYSFFTKVSFALVVLLAAYIVFLRLWQQFLRYREQGYRKYILLPFFYRASAHSLPGQ